MFKKIAKWLDLVATINATESVLNDTTYKLAERELQLKHANDRIAALENDLEIQKQSGGAVAEMLQHTQEVNAQLKLDNKDLKAHNEQLIKRLDVAERKNRWWFNFILEYDNTENILLNKSLWGQKIVLAPEPDTKLKG